MLGADFSLGEKLLQRRQEPGGNQTKAGDRRAGDRGGPHQSRAQDPD